MTSRAEAMPTRFDDIYTKEEQEEEQKQVSECPLCAESLDEDGIKFLPCSCCYQICIFCYWELFVTTKKCPNCRKAYEEQYLEEWQRRHGNKNGENEKKIEKQHSKKVNFRTDLFKVKSYKKNLVYVTGLDSKHITPQVLKSRNYFGKVGKVINAKMIKKGKSKQNIIYITYSTEAEATEAINEFNGKIENGKRIKAQFGHTRYCSKYLNNTPCLNFECPFLHQRGVVVDSTSKEGVYQRQARYNNSFGNQFATLCGSRDSGDTKLNDLLPNNSSQHPRKSNDESSSKAKTTQISLTDSRKFPSLLEALKDKTKDKNPISAKKRKKKENKKVFSFLEENYDSHKPMNEMLEALNPKSEKVQYKFHSKTFKSSELEECSSFFTFLPPDNLEHSIAENTQITVTSIIKKNTQNFKKIDPGPMKDFVLTPDYLSSFSLPQRIIGLSTICKIMNEQSN